MQLNLGQDWQEQIFLKTYQTVTGDALYPFDMRWIARLYVKNLNRCYLIFQYKQILKKVVVTCELWTKFTNNGISVIIYRLPI